MTNAPWLAVLPVEGQARASKEQYPQERAERPRQFLEPFQATNRGRPECAAQSVRVRGPRIRGIREPQAADAHASARGGAGRSVQVLDEKARVVDVDVVGLAVGDQHDEGRRRPGIAQACRPAAVQGGRAVKKHLEHVFEKLGVETRAAAAALASRSLA
jgi:hypothetical protein